jgi:hypothetical protein
MITLDLRKQDITLEELLQFASSDSVLIRARDGQEFVLESADEFDKEVAALGRSEKFMEFLASRSTEAGTVTLEDLKKELESKADQNDLEHS